jgi:hypothetical protein
MARVILFREAGMGRSLGLLVVVAAMAWTGVAQAEPAMETADIESSAEAARQLREAIAVAQQTDPELARILEQELEQLSAGEDPSYELQNLDVAQASIGAHMLFREPTFGGPESMPGDVTEHDPRILALRRQYESGALTEEQFEAKLLELLHVAPPEDPMDGLLPMDQPMHDDEMMPELEMMPESMEGSGVPQP